MKIYTVNSKQNVEADNNVAAPVTGKRENARAVNNKSVNKWWPKASDLIFNGNFSTRITIAKKDINPIMRPVSIIVNNRSLI